MGNLEFYVTHWWQISILVIVFAYSIRIIGSDIEPLLDKLNNIVVSLSKELSLQSPAGRAATMNLVLAALAFVVAIILIVPNLLVQIGIQEEQNSMNVILGIVLILFVFTMSGFFLYLFEFQLPAFKDDDEIDLDDD